jgi:DNA primase large subunit
MMDKKVPIETMVEFFRGLPEFDKSYTIERIETYISLGYSPMTCETLWEKAPTFCLKDSCEIWQGVHSPA